MQTTIDPKKAEIELFFLKRIKDYRSEYDKLTDQERRFVAEPALYREPCQIEVFWINEPVEFQLIIILHEATRDDREIIINGPFKGSEFINAVFEIAEEVRWKKITPYEVNQFDLMDVDVQDQERKYSDFLIHSLQDLIFNARNSPFVDFKPGVISGAPFRESDWYSVIKGNVVDLKKDELWMIDSIWNAKKYAAMESNNEEERPRQEFIQQSIKTENTRQIAFGAYFYPHARIGDEVELSFKDKLVRAIGSPMILPQAEFSFTLNGKSGFYDTYGHIGIQTEKKNQALKALNTIFGISNLMGFPAFSVKESELIELSVGPDGFNLGVTSWNSENKRSKPFSPPTRRKIKIPTNSMVEIINCAEIALNNHVLNEAVLFFLESLTHQNNEEYSQSFLYSWLIIENHVSEAFDELLDNKGVSEKRKKKFNSHDKWTIESKIEILNLEGKISDNDYQFLIHYNKIRNNFAHRGSSVNDKDSKTVLDFAQTIIQDIFEEDKKP